ncbi:hypothetical protein Tco_0761628, partial [Tanacetum coccineum]
PQNYHGRIYIRIEEEKARRHGKVYNWETATYGRIWDDDEVHNLRSVETEFSAIVFDDMYTSQAAFSCEPTVSPLNNNEIDFRILFDESDDENYMNEFPAIVYNDALTSKSDFLTEPTMCPQHVNEFNLKDKTSLSKCDGEEHNVIYFNDLFPFNVIYPDDISDKDNDDDKIDIKQSSMDNVINTDVGAYAQGYQYGVSWGMDTAYRLLDLVGKEIEKIAFSPRKFITSKYERPQNYHGRIYIRIEEEKARRHGKVYNWETATYGRIWDDDEVHNLRSVETEFSAIVFDDTYTSQAALSCEPTVSPLNNNEIDFRISFDESDDENYMVIFDKNSFSYKIIYVDNLKTDSENDFDKVNMPSFPSPNPTVSYLDDLDYLKDFENEFPAIVYNDALTSKSDFLTESNMCPQHVDEFNLKDKTSLSKCDGEEHNVIYFNDLFPFNVIYPDDISDKDNDDDKIDIKQSSKDNVINTLSIRPYPIKNLYLSFGILFDPILFYKDGIKVGYQYGVSWGMDTAYRLLDLVGKEIEKIGEVSIIWNPMRVL